MLHHGSDAPRSQRVHERIQHRQAHHERSELCVALWIHRGRRQEWARKAQTVGNSGSKDRRVLRRDHNGYYFNPEQEVALYNPNRVLHGLQQLEKTLSIPSKYITLSPEDGAVRLLSRIPDDDSMPSEATLRAIVSNPNASLVIADALSSDTAELDCEGGVKGQFRLSHMNELATDRKPLLSFMFFTGALTCVPSTAVRLRHALRIPNSVARTEFAKELEQMIGLKEGGYDSLREAIITMLDTKKIDSFCGAVSKYLLGGLAGRDVKGGEDPFAQGGKNQVCPCVFELTLKFFSCL